MRPSATKFAFMALALMPLLCADRARAQDVPMKAGTNLSSVVFYDPPNESQVRVRLSGAQMSSLPGAIYDVKQLKIEEFAISGKLQAVAEAPQCTYAVQDEIATSPGSLLFHSGDGRMSTKGEGFYWQQSDSTLYISNKVHTVILLGTNSWRMPNL